MSKSKPLLADEARLARESRVALGCSLQQRWQNRELTSRGGRPSLADARLLSDYILDQGWELLLAVGFDRFSIDRLVRYARVGKPTIYARYAGKTHLLRAMLERRITARHDELVALATDMSVHVALPLLALRALEMFLSPEGRLVDRLIEWLDHEARDPAVPSARQWAVLGALENTALVMQRADARRDVRFRDIPTAARFFVEGVIGHGRLCDADTPFHAEDHRVWAERYCAMIIATFADPSS